MAWGYVSESGREYAIVGLSSGTSFVEITDPGNPQILQFIDGPKQRWIPAEFLRAFHKRVYEHLLQPAVLRQQMHGLRSVLVQRRQRHFHLRRQPGLCKRNPW